MGAWRGSARCRELHGRELVADVVGPPIPSWGEQLAHGRRGLGDTGRWRTVTGTGGTEGHSPNLKYREFTSRSIYRLADLERIKPIHLGKATAAQLGLTAADFAELLQSREYKNGCVVAVWTSEDFATFYEQLRERSRQVVAQIDAELAGR